MPDTDTAATTATLVSQEARASSAHARINIPLNLDNWRALAPDIQADLLWLHQWLLDNKLSWKDSEEALSYDRSTIFRVLKGTYEGSWAKVCESIRSFRRLQEKRLTITKNEFAHNSLSKLIWAGLDYALANNSITTIIGESRMGKSIASNAWCVANNHGRSVPVVAPPVGGAKGLMRVIASKVGVNKNLSTIQMLEALHRSFNANRILVVDEAHRLMPGDARAVNPASLEFLRDLHDQTGCALALIATARFDDRLRSGTYQFEQLIGRIGMPIRLPNKVKRTDLLPIVLQFVESPSDHLLEELDRIANAAGRLGILTESLKVASRIASKAGQPLGEEHIHRALAIRAQMSNQPRND